MSQPSIRRRLLAILLSVISGFWLLVGYWVYLESTHEVEEVFDANLAQAAKVLLDLVHHEHAEGVPLENAILTSLPLADQGVPLGHKYEAKIAFAVTSLDGRATLRSRGAPKFHRKRIGFHDQTLGGLKWRVFTLKDPQMDILVQTGEQYAVRQELVTEITFSTLAPLLLSLPLLAALIWFSVGRSLRPLGRVTQEISRRAPTHLEPVPVANVPREVRPLLDALNNLFEVLQRAFDNERRFTADAAHELRTPLAGIRTQAEVARTTPDPVKRQQALDNILTGTVRATHLVGQLLSLARMDAQHSLPLTPVSLNEVCVDVLTDLEGEARRRDIDLGLEQAPEFPPRVIANLDAMYLLLRNLVDNAIRYTQPSGQVTVKLELNGQNGPRLEVRDNGPGIPPAQRDKILERFCRGEQSAITSGSGIGLSIARRVAELHRAELCLTDGDHGQGLCVRLDFPGSWTRTEELVENHDPVDQEKSKKIPRVSA